MMESRLIGTKLIGSRLAETGSDHARLIRTGPIESRTINSRRIRIQTQHRGATDGRYLPADGPGEFSATSRTIFSTTADRCGSCPFTTLDAATDELGTVAFAGLRASSKVPHIPQKRKVFELFSPHFGQITMVLPRSFSLILSLTPSLTPSFTLSFILTLAGNVIRFIHSY